MQLMGHADIQTTLIYVMVTPQDAGTKAPISKAAHHEPGI
jgi:site-specific recombinase XerD